MTNLDIYQQVFTLSIIANASTTLKKETEPEVIQKWFIKTLPTLLTFGQVPEWQPVHGPTIWTHPGGKGADNAWFIAHNPAAQFDDGVHDTYVLAIAGTATNYDWVWEDFAVLRVVNFDAWMSAGIHSEYKLEPVFKVKDKKHPYISSGTARGTSILLNTPAPPGTAAPGVGKTIVEFIASLPPTARLVITGHSLGSALSSTVACALKKCGELNKLEKALVFPTAGATPGNALFAQYFSSSFPITAKPSTPESVYKAWNSNLWNTLDIVPHAWSVKAPNQQVADILTIWPMEGKAKEVVEGMVYAAKKLVAWSQISYTPLQGYSWKGGPPPVPVAITVDDLADNARWEHVSEYVKFFGLKLPTETGYELASTNLEEFGLDKKTDLEVVEDQPFLELLRAVKDEPAEFWEDGKAEASEY